MAVGLGREAALSAGGCLSRGMDASLLHGSALQGAQTYPGPACSPNSSARELLGCLHHVCANKSISSKNGGKLLDTKPESIGG